ncbi:MAG: pirin family protein [Deltaproteobacteria bacterium]|nr:MAG: pirin family protein [Deltaproteobacteria bacterium]
MNRRRISARMRSIGPFEVRRILPSPWCRQVGPWVFLDHFGPVAMPAGQGADVPPHPHCGLSTVTYLFEGAVEHRDSTGGHAIVRPGEVHWMRAGHGIVHSERTPAERKAAGGRSHGLQLWCAHPDGEEEQAPRFDSWRELPELDVDGVRVQLLAGAGWGAESPVDVTSPLVYALAHLRQGQRLVLPDAEELCAYAVSGGFSVDGERAGPHELLLVDPGTLEATEDAVVALLGGDAIGERHMWWNLVHSDRGRLREQAERYRRGEFPEIPEDPGFLPAPEHGP